MDFIGFLLFWFVVITFIIGIDAVIRGPYVSNRKIQRPRAIKQGWASMPTKQRLNIIGGILFGLGLILLLVGWHMYSHNRELNADYAHNKNMSDWANDKLRGININNDMAVQQGMRDAHDAAEKATHSRWALMTQSYSSELVIILFLLGGFLSLFGFVLQVVGWVLPVTGEGRRSKAIEQ